MLASPTMGSKKGQAMLETVLLIPFVIVMIFFIYQAYITVNRVQVVQRYLKTEVINKLMNRYEVTVEQKTSTNTNGKTPTDGQYFFVYNEFPSGGSLTGMNAGLDKSTAAVLLTFARGTDANLGSRLTDAVASPQAMGLCIGGGSIMNDQVDTKVLNIAPDDICNKK